MRQFVSRDDFYKSGNHYYFLEKLEKGYGRVNSFLKVIRLIKPTIMMVNNMFQGLTANPAFLLHLPWAYRTYFKRFEKGAFGNEEYWLFNGANLFNRASAPEGLVPDATRAAYELAGKNITMSKMADDMAGKNFFQKAGVAATYGFKRWQEFSWAIDDMFRLAICKSFYDRAGRTYTDKRQAASVSAALTNTMMVEYSRIPTHTRMALNRVFLYPTYRIGTMRMFKEMAQMGVRGIRGIVNGEIKDTPYRLYNDPKKQAFFEMGFAFRTVAVQAATKAAAAIFLGYGADTIFQAMFDYRAKKKTGDDQYDQDIKILSMSGPIFDLSKYFSRPLEVTLRYNMAAFPGLIVSWATNKNIITQQRIVTADWKKEPQKALAQVGLDLFRTYLPFSGEYCNWADKDLAIAEKIINEFGIGYFYSQENPKSILTDFLAATDKAKTIGEQKKAWADYKYKMDRASRVLTGVAFKSVQDERKAQQELLDATTKN
jgi:hypothetical protein